MYFVLQKEIHIYESTQVIQEELYSTKLSTTIMNIIETEKIYNEIKEIETSLFNKYESVSETSIKVRTNLSSYNSYYETSKNEKIKSQIYELYINITSKEMSMPTYYKSYFETSRIDKIIIDYYESFNFTSEEINKKIYEQLINMLTENFDLLKEKDQIIEGKDNFYFHFTTSENELNSLNGNNSNNFSIIDLGKCEKILKEQNNIDKNLSLLILKFEKISNISSERNLQYEIYEPINKTKLNLSVCQDIPIDIYIPTILSEKLNNLYNELKNLGYDLFDINNDFYQDICTPYKSSNGTDVILSDRLNYYFNNEETQCQPNCKFSNYSLESQYLKCECSIEKTEIVFEKSNHFESKTIYKSFYDILKYSNYKVLKCYKLVFNSKIFKNNIGNIITIVYLGIYCVFLIIYLINGTSLLKTDISKNIIEINQKDIKKDINKNNSININIGNKLKFKKNNIELKNNINTQKINNKKSILRKEFKKRRTQPRIIFDFPPKKTLNHNNELIIISKDKLNIEKSNKYAFGNDFIDSNKDINEKNNLQNIYKLNLSTVIYEEKLDNYELNDLDYDVAIKIDKRRLLEIYWSLLKREHLIIFTFITKDDHNIKYIKYSRFIFLVCTDMALNVFFFSDETMHKMFLDYGKYNFIQQIPQIVYTTIVSQVIEIFLCFLSLTDKYYYQIKNLKIKSQNEILRIVKIIQLKFCVFYIFTGIMFLFYWYIITSFCSVYENTQTAFIKDSLLSFAFGLLYPFFIYIIPTLLRITSLKFCDGKLSFIYKLSDIIPFF